MFLPRRRDTRKIAYLSMLKSHARSISNVDIACLGRDISSDYHKADDVNVDSLHNSPAIHDAMDVEDAATGRDEKHPVCEGPIDDGDVPSNPFQAKLHRLFSFIHSKCVDAELIKGVHVSSSQTPQPAWTFQPVASSATAGLGVISLCRPYCWQVVIDVVVIDVVVIDVVVLHLPGKNVRWR
ncbi:hypothetical protein B0T18DRAFT_393371 [Schizothecium vesticola]|uniref:Uncharacterized protein n=1 Tax=Schizothecium vesticola TaxID=314040 RepID=A0AA40EJP9_9PEZI|nr:hypothetical protein B0T18DRAFT_393371 [Schizothecium vesticola]